MESSIIKSHIIYRKEMALILGVYTVACLLLILLSIYYLKSSGLSFLFAMVMILPFLFMKTIITKFSRKIDIELADDKLFITIKKLKEEQGVKTEYFLNDINTYCIQFPNSKFSTIQFGFKNDYSLNYSFFQKEIDINDTKTNVLIQKLHDFIQNYNKKCSIGDQILLQPSFFASSGGLICIYFLIVAFSIAIFLHGMFNPKTLPITLFMAIALLIQIIIRRNADMDYFKKLNS